MPQCHPKFFTSSLNWGWAHRVPGRAEKKADACSLYFCLCKLYTYKAVGVLMCGKRRELKGLRRSWPIWEGCLCFLNYELFQQQNIYNPVKKMNKGLEYTVLQRRRANGQ